MINQQKANENAVAEAIKANYEIYADGNNPCYHNFKKAEEAVRHNASENLDTYTIERGIKLAKKLIGC